MTRMFLIASVAALALTAPANAQRGEKEDRAKARAEAQAERGQKARGGEREERGQREARPQREQRVQADRPQRQQREQADRPQRQQRESRQVQRPQREQRVQMDRPQREQRVRAERPRPEQRARPERRVEQRARVERPQREQRVRAERPQREQRVQNERVQREQRVRVERQREQRVRTQKNERVERLARTNERSQQRLRQQEQQQQAQRIARNQGRDDRRMDRIERRDDRRFDREARADQRIGLAEFREQRRVRPQRSVGERVNLSERRDNRDWYNGFAQQRYQTFYGTSPNYFYDYNYDDGYLYQLNRDYRVVGLYPVLGGAFGIGRALPIGYDDYNVPYGYRSLYYDTPDSYYRYGDGAIYRVDRDTQLIQAVVALLTGQSLGVGQRLPLGYDVYNVPYAYRSQYQDRDDMWFRYDDGYIYGVDPYSRMVRNVYPVSYGYNVGYPVPSYASYGGYGGSAYGYGGYGGYDAGYSGYDVPYDYRDLYYAEPGYNYHYANGGIYQVDPSTQLVSALVALVTGTSLGVGQALPMGYDVYNVPYAYRASYMDTPDAWYRYDDGTIYQVDPRSRIIQAAIPVYDGYAVGYPMPAYAGYAVPDTYDGLYYAEPNYDYRYLNGGIYQVDRDTRMVNGVAALLTGHSLGVGQALPMGYDVYNVPIAYRDDYRDTPDAWYRYNDGHIYQVDPQTRLIQAVIDAVA